MRVTRRMAGCPTRSSQPASHDLGRRTRPVKSFHFSHPIPSVSSFPPRASFGEALTPHSVHDQVAHERRTPTRGMSRLLLAMVLHTHTRRACAVPRIFNWEEPVKRADIEALRHAADQASELPASMGLGRLNGRPCCCRFVFLSCERWRKQLERS